MFVPCCLSLVTSLVGFYLLFTCVCYGCKLVTSLHRIVTQAITNKKDTGMFSFFFCFTLIF